MEGYSRRSDVDPVNEKRNPADYESNLAIAGLNQKTAPRVK
jgi:hypothetical protein